MVIEPSSVQVQVELSGAGGGWTPLVDVLKNPGIRASYGIQGNTPQDRVASTGEMTFQLNNGPSNSQAKIGLYSPDHVNKLLGWAVGIGIRLAITYSGVTYYKWRGVVEDIMPIPGIEREKRVSVVCVDWMDEAAKVILRAIPVQLNKRSDQLFKIIVQGNAYSTDAGAWAGVPRQPPAISAGLGMETYAYGLDNVMDESTTAMSEIQKLCNSELGFSYPKGDTVQGGTLVFEDRRKRGTFSADLASFDDNSLSGMEVDHGRAGVINDVKVTAHPRRVDAAATAVLFVAEFNPQIMRGTSYSFSAPYRDPDQKATRVGGVSMVTPVASTDYTFHTLAGGAGADITSQLSVAVTFGGNSAQVTITNNGPLDGYLDTGFRLRGKGVYSYEEIVATVLDTASQATYGRNDFSLDMPYESRPATAEEAAWYILNNNKTPSTRVNAIQFVANHSDTVMRAALEREISDRIGIVETVTGIASSHFINSVDITILDELFVTCSWGLAPAISEQYWILEVDGFTELGLTTKLAYGLFQTYWILDISHLGVDTRMNA